MTSQLKSTNPLTLLLHMGTRSRRDPERACKMSMMDDLAVTGLHGGGGGGGDAGGDGGAVVLVVVVVLLLLLPGRAGWCCCCCSPKAPILVAILPQLQVRFDSPSR